MSTYVALGDSFSSGEGNKGSGWVDTTGVADKSPTSTDGCDRSIDGYPEHVAASMNSVKSLGLTGLKLVYLACSGATTTDVWSSSPASSTSGLVGATSNHGEGAQLADTADLAHARIVTLTAGGDDLDFPAIVETCVVASLGRTAKGIALATALSPLLGLSVAEIFHTGPSLCSKNSPVSAVSNVMKNVSDLEETLIALYRQVEIDAPHAAVYVVGYPDLLPPSPTHAELKDGCGSLSGSFLEFLAPIAPAVDTEIQAAARVTGAIYVNPNSGAYSFLGGGGHTLCSTTPWFHALNTSYLTGGSLTNGSYHPNVLGQDELALSVEAMIKADDSASDSALKGVKDVISDGSGYCALLTSGGVDCWGAGDAGQLGNGQFYDSGNEGSAVPVSVVSTSGVGKLMGVVSLTSDGFAGNGYCALLTSGGVVCWGDGSHGALGDGQFYDTGSYGSAIPVSVVATNGVGDLTSVASLTSDAFGYCALLTSGDVDCWGDGSYGELGNSQFYDSGNYGSAIPVSVVAMNGVGSLTGVTSLTSGVESYCALLTSGSVDCWGDGDAGLLGNGQFYDSGNEGSAVPVSVVSTSGAGKLTGVASLTSDGFGDCALLTSGSVDCWGNGPGGQLGDDEFSDSAIPVAVVGTKGTGMLAGVAKLSSDGDSYCAVLTSTGVDCWGSNENGELGNGEFDGSGSDGSAIPESVVATSGIGILTGVAGLTGVNGYGGYCALLAAGDINCWGYGGGGALGNGQFYGSGNDGSAVPVSVLATNGSGILAGVVSVVGDGGDGYCALLAVSSVDCWGYGYNGQLGNGQYNASAVPVPVI